MSDIRIVFAACLFGLWLPQPARAWDGGDAGPFAFLSHHYGDDMYQPPITPDRPYWHGDDAVPPDLRWHDRQIEVVDEYGFTVGTRLPEPEVVSAAVSVETAETRPHPRVRRLAVEHRRKRSRIARMICPPPLRPLPPIVAPAQPILPPVPAPTEH